MFVFQGRQLFVSSLMLLECVIITLKQETPHLNRDYTMWFALSITLHAIDKSNQDSLISSITVSLKELPCITNNANRLDMKCCAKMTIISFCRLCNCGDKHVASPMAAVKAAGSCVLLI